MRYLLSVVHDSDGRATGDEMAAIDAFNEGLRARGQWVFAVGVGGPATATLVDNRDGADVVSLGPYVEAPEYVAGFWVVEAADAAEALALARAGSKACHRKVEVRPVL